MQKRLLRDVHRMDLRRKDRGQIPLLETDYKSLFQQNQNASSVVFGIRIWNRLDDTSIIRNRGAPWSLRGSTSIVTESGLEEVDK